MKRIKRIFLPKWQRWYAVPLLLGIWVLVTYLEFFSAENDEKLGLVGYVIISGVLLVSGIMMWLMSGGKLPAYIIEEEEEGES